MGVTLKHAIKINATPEQVFSQLTQLDGMASWHHGAVEGDVAVGSILYLTSKPGLKFGWKTIELEPNTRLVQECVEGPGSSVGKTLTFSLTESDGQTQVDLSDGEWDEGDSSIPFCNTSWGIVLLRLKEHLEK